MESEDELIASMVRDLPRPRLPARFSAKEERDWYEELEKFFRAALRQHETLLFVPGIQSQLVDAEAMLCKMRERVAEAEAEAKEEKRKARLLRVNLNGLRRKQEREETYFNRAMLVLTKAEHVRYVLSLLLRALSGERVPGVDEAGELYVVNYLPRVWEMAWKAVDKPQQPMAFKMEPHAEQERKGLLARLWGKR